METFTPSPYLIYYFPLNDIIILLKYKNKVNFFTNIKKNTHTLVLCMQTKKYINNCFYIVQKVRVMNYYYYFF